MFYGNPRINNGDGIYNGGGGGGGGGEIADLNEYFDNVYVYWNDTNNSYPAFTPVASFSNDNLFIMNKLYCPTKYNRDFPFSGEDGSDYSIARLRIQFGSGWLYNGTNGSNINIPQFSAGEMILKVERNAFTFNGATYIGHYAPYTIRSIWPIPTGNQSNPIGAYSKMSFKELLFIDKITNQIYAHYYGVKRLSDGALGVFDMVKGTFYTNNKFAMYNV